MIRHSATRLHELLTRMRFLRETTATNHGGTPRLPSNSHLSAQFGSHGHCECLLRRINMRSDPPYRTDALRRPLHQTNTSRHNNLFKRSPQYIYFGSTISTHAKYNSVSSSEEYDSRLLHVLILFSFACNLDICKARRPPRLLTPYNASLIYQIRQR